MKTITIKEQKSWLCITLKEARKMVREIKNLALTDDEAAHVTEDDLRFRVLYTISKDFISGKEAKTLASIACNTDKIGFQRWYS